MLIKIIYFLDQLHVLATMNETSAGCPKQPGRSEGRYFKGPGGPGGPGGQEVQEVQEVQREDKIFRS